MRSNGRSDQRECSSSSGIAKAIASLVGGIGIGAGLLYLLDPDKGVKRRQQLMAGASDLASNAKDYAGDALGNMGSVVGGAISSAKDFASEKLGMARDYATEHVGGAGDYANQGLSYAQKLALRGRNQARDFIQRQTFGETRAEHRLGVTLCALGSMAMGAALMYALDPTLGRSRRRYVREQAGNLASHAGDYARQAGDMIRQGIDTAKEKAGMTGSMPSDNTTTTKTGVQQSQPSATAY